jgi:hypothetical protein
VAAGWGSGIQPGAHLYIDRLYIDRVTASSSFSRPSLALGCSFRYACFSGALAQAKPSHFTIFNLAAKSTPDATLKVERLTAAGGLLLAEGGLRELGHELECREPALRDVQAKSEKESIRFRRIISGGLLWTVLTPPEVSSWPRDFSTSRPTCHWPLLTLVVGHVRWDVRPVLAELASRAEKRPYRVPLFSALLKAGATMKCDTRHKSTCSPTPPTNICRR